MKTTYKVWTTAVIICMLLGMVLPSEAAAIVVYRKDNGQEQVSVRYYDDDLDNYDSIVDSLNLYEVEESVEPFALKNDLLAVEDYSYDSQNNTARLSAKLSGVSAGLEVLAAVYDENGQLIGVSMDQVDVLKSLNFNIRLKSVPEGSYKTKVFVLESMRSLKPVALSEMTYIYDEGEYSLRECSSLYIDAAGVRLKDTDIKKDIIISEKVGSGNVEMKNVDVTGNIYVNGGGTNSILFGSVNVSGAVIINKVGDDIRIVVTNKSNMNIKLESGAIIVTDGSQKISEVEISGGLAGKNIVMDGSFGQVTGDAANVNISAEGEIDEILLNKSATITGNAVIGRVETKEGADSTVNGTSIPGGSSVTLPGPSSAAAGEAAKYEKAVTIPADVNEKEDVTDKVVLLKSGEHANGDYEVSISEKADIGDYLTVISNSVTLKRQAKSYSGYAVLTLTFTNKYNDSDKASVNVSVTISSPGWQDAENVDSRFAKGYPKVEVDPETNYMMFKLKLKSGIATKDNPVEAFMILNQINPHFEADVQSVVHGHTGTIDDAIYVDDWPYLCICDDREYTVKTQTEITGAKEVKAHFVLNGSSGLSDMPTSVRFDAIAINEIDNRAPKLRSAYINKARNKIFMYYDEILDPESVPVASSFTVNGATVNKVTIEKWHNGRGLVILDILGIDTGLTDAQIGSNITVKYTPPEVNKLRDISINHNECEKTTMTVDVATVLLNAENVKISVDKKYIHIATVNNEDPYRDNDYEVEIRYGKGLIDSTIMQYKIIGKSNYSYGGGSDIYLSGLDNDSILKNEGKFYISLIPEGEMYDYAQDRITETLTVEVLPEAVSSKVMKAEYDGINLKLTLQGSQDDNTIALCSFTLSVNGQPHILRGFKNMYNDILIFDNSNIPVNIKAGDELKLTYEPQHKLWDEYLLIEPSGRPMDTFKDMEVVNLMK